MSIKSSLSKKLLTLIPMLALVLSINSAQAHAPETHIIHDLCTDTSLGQWHNESGPCDPSNPPNLADGITHSDYQHGLCYPTFNNYVDEVDINTCDDPNDLDTCLGMDPYGSNNPPLFKDERNFFQVAKVEEIGQSVPWANFGDTVTVQDGNILQFYLYIHNDGDPCFNDNIDISDEKFYSEWNTTSHGTKIQIEEPLFSDDGGIATKAINEKTTLKAAIWSNDAINEYGVKGGKTYDTVQITPNNNEELNLQYIPNSAIYIDMRNDAGYDWWFYTHPIDNILPFFSSVGMPMSTIKNISGDIKGSNGDYYASEPYIGLVRFQMEVKAPTLQVCTNLDIEREGSKLYNGEETAYMIRVAKMEFGTDPIPAGTQIKWTTTDPDGKFWLGNKETEEGTWVDEDFPSWMQAGVLWSEKTITTNTDDYVYYIGTGTVSAYTDTVDDSLESVLCEDSVVMPVVEAVCDALQVDHPQTITEGTLSWFRADALDTNEEAFASPITYSVTPGYGYFFTTKPTGYTDNESPTVYEPEIAYIPFWDIAGSGIIFTGADLIEGTDDDDEEADYSIDPEIMESLVSSIATGNFWSVSPAGIQNPGDLIDPEDLYEVNDNPLNIPVTAGPDPSPIENPGTMDSQIMNPGSAGLTEGMYNNFETINPSSFGQISVFDIPTNTYGLSKIQNNGMNYALGNIPIPEEDYSITPDYSGLLDHEILTVQPGSIDLNQDIIDISLSTITVEQGDIVYFYAKKPGTNVITIKTTDSDETGCERTFSIIAAPVIEKLDCASAKLTAETTSKTYPTCMSEENGKVALTVDFTSTTDQKINTANVQVKWTATSPGFEYDAGDMLTAVQNQFVNGVSTHYTGSGSITASLFTLEGEPYDGEAACTVTIPACDVPPLCAQLDITSDPLAAFVGESTMLTASGTDTLGTALPNSTLITWSNTADGKFDATGDDMLGNFSPTTETINRTIHFKNSTQAGEVTAAIAAEDPMFSEVCKDSIPVVEVPSSLVCENLAATVTKIDGGEVDSLVPGEDYILEATATYSEEYPNGTLTYSIDPAIGQFYKLTEYEPDTENIGTGDQDMHPFIKGLVEKAVDFAQENGYILQIFESTIIVNEDEEVYLMTYKYANAVSVQNALIMEATEFPNCIEYYDLIVLPVNQEWACVDLDIVKPNSNWDIDDKDNEQSVKIEVETTPNGHEDDLYYHWELSGVHDEEWDESGDDEHVDIGDTTQKFTWDKDTGEPLIRVWASYEEDGDEITACEDWVRADIDDDDEDEPEFLKQAYINDNHHDISDADDELNIGSGSSNQELTYIYTFKAGNSDIDWVHLEDEDFTSGQFIKGDKEGRIDYKGMRINIKPSDYDEDYYEDHYDGDNDYKHDNNHDGFTILEEGDYDEEDDDDDYFDEGDFKNSDDYEERYECNGDNSNDFCFEYDEEEDDDKDYDYDEGDFVKGKIIRFENIEKGMVIMIKVQVDNNTKINTKYCADLTTAEGCGEEFNNKASYKTETGDKGKADATIIAVCPYVLTRSGGDVFFHDVIDTGIDVSYCSPVKSSTGAGITKNPKSNPIIPSTGIEKNDPNAILTLPTHDVCQYSNSKYALNNMEEYRNPLENFSSTICELRAEISENWKEDHIKNTIKANIDRIARWGESLTNINGPNATINGINELIGATNSESGVYIKTGNLTIDLSEPKALTATNPFLPAAKTFIVMDGNLTIKKDIHATMTDTEVNPNEVPSFAFIVINGDIIIDNSVGRIDGVLMAVDLDQINEGEAQGRILPTGISDGSNDGAIPTTTNLLIINGSLFGNVYDLFSARQGVGEPGKDEGSVTIRYDERILLNTPPGISELVDVATTLIP